MKTLIFGALALILAIFLAFHLFDHYFSGIEYLPPELPTTTSNPATGAELRVNKQPVRPTSTSSFSPPGFHGPSGEPTIKGPTGAPPG